MEEVKRFFLEASLNTYAADAPKTTLEALPKSKELRYERGDFLYVDMYYSSGYKSGGQTVIWYKGNPVWIMQYQGWWQGDDERVILFLKHALKAADGFVGGRGPEIFQKGSLEYRNNVWRN